jgi:hypothetical protein
MNFRSKLGNILTKAGICCRTWYRQICNMSVLARSCNAWPDAGIFRTGLIWPDVFRVLAPCFRSHASIGAPCLQILPVFICEFDYCACPEMKELRLTLNRNLGMSARSKVACNEKRWPSPLQRLPLVGAEGLREKSNQKLNEQVDSDPDSLPSDLMTDARSELDKGKESYTPTSLQEECQSSRDLSSVARNVDRRSRESGSPQNEPLTNTYSLKPRYCRAPIAEKPVTQQPTCSIWSLQVCSYSSMLRKHSTWIAPYPNFNLTAKLSVASVPSSN